MKMIAQGAESKLYENDDTIVKVRFKKKYRIPEIDDKLRGFRTRREAKILSKLDSFPSPSFIETDEKEKIVMSKIDGPLVKKIFDKDYNKLSPEIGKLIGELHNNNIIHGDLTTSNMIFDRRVYIIDFGLSFFSYKIEDKAVDLKLLMQALESKHHKVFKKAFESILKSYQKNCTDAKKVLERLNQVEKRGRYKQKK